MINFVDSIFQKINNIDYAWNKPILVLVGFAMWQWIENLSHTSAAYLAFYELNPNGTIKAMHMKNPPKV